MACSGLALRPRVLHQHTDQVCVPYMAFIQLYIEYRSGKNYVIQENMWSSSSSTSQRMNQTTSKVFFRYTSKSIYIMTNFHTSDELHRGPEFSYNYIINYIIITSSLLNNHKKVNCYWGCNLYTYSTY